MSISWPPDLVEALVQRRAIIFLGAGASASCTAVDGSRFPTWRKLLEELNGELDSDDCAAAERAIDRSRLLDAAQIVTDKVTVPRRETILSRVLANRQVRPSELYKYVSLLDQPIVMTTNYDTMYERYWEGMLESGDDQLRQLYVSRYYDDDIVDHLRSARQVLFKLHGDIGQVRKIILSRSEYASAKYKHANFFKVVSALFLTRTVLFIGCGFNGDPDVELILEDAAFAAQSGWPHYAAIPQGRHPSEIRTIRSAFNVHCLEYDNSAGTHADLIEALRDLSDLVVNGRN